MHELLCVVGDSLFFFFKCMEICSHQREMNKIIHSHTQNMYGTLYRYERIESS